MARRPVKTMLLSAALSLVVMASSSEARAEGGAKAEDKPAPPKAITASNVYVHSWIPMPSFTPLRLIGDEEPVTIRPTTGRLMVVVFLASWCEPCQQLMPQLQRLERRYQRLNTDFYYIFAHDTRDDALGFVKEFQLGHGFLANQELLKTFHAPELPSIYVGDRHGWMLQRYLKTTPTDLTKLDDLLQYLAAY